MKTNKVFEVAVTIDNQLIEDMLVTALEGGSNYWYYLPETFMVIKDDNKSLAERIFMTIMTTKDKIPVHDAECRDDVLGYITFESLQKGIDKLQSDYPEHYNDMMNESYDAETADVWFQLSIMGEIVYG